MRKSWIVSVAVGIFTTGLACGWWLGSGPDDNSVNGRSANFEVGTPDASESAQTFSRHPAPPIEFASRLNEVNRHRGSLRRARLIDSIAVDLNAADIRDALDELERTPIREKTEILMKILARWGELEPEAAMEYARALPEDPGVNAIKTIIRSWANRNLKATEDWIEKQPNCRAKTIARSGLIDALSERDPKRAFSIAEKTGVKYDFIPLFERWGVQNPEEAATQAALVPPGFWHDRAIEAAAQKWAEADVESALAWAQSLPANNGYSTSIERRDPKALAAVLQTWIGKDADAALLWLKQLPDDVAKTDVLAVLSRSLSDTDPARAVDLAAMMPSGKSQDSALHGLIEKWSNKDLTGALAWAQDQPDPEVRRILLPTLVNRLARQDTEAALQLALTIGEKGGERVVSNVLRQWAAKTPAAAAAWVDTQPINPEYTASVAAAWAREDQSAAAQWINRIPAGPNRDQVLSTVVSRLAWDKPQVAAGWAAGISDDGKRSSIYRDIAFKWLQVDPKAARAWIDQSSFPANFKAQLLQPRSK